jgi:hypothetical protein
MDIQVWITQRLMAQHLQFVDSGKLLHYCCGCKEESDEQASYTGGEQTDDRT